jgi:hypothetical protein
MRPPPEHCSLAVLTALVAVGATACDPALDQRLALVDAPRVLAVIAEPAEAAPGDEVTYTAVIASAEGPRALAPRWAFCTTPKPPTEDNVVAPGCIAGEDLVELGTQSTVTGTLPDDACIRFGPDVPPGGYRPRDPDPTGGYYQPVRVEVAGDVAIGASRITCNLAGAPLDVARRFVDEYVANENPVLEPLVLERVPAHTDVTLTARWPASSAETYLYYDRETRQLVTRREALRVSWYATSGELGVDASAVGEDDPATSVATTWRTPGPGTAWLWLVLRDSRGGVTTQAVAVTIE